jgi:cell division protein ZapA (FtsZ GTPase activity inhibitor)
MSKETVSIRIFGRDMTFSVSPKEKNNLIKSAEILNNELENISDKNNALVIAGLNLASKSLNQKESSSNKNSDVNLSKLIEKIDKTLEK